jgi:hypothetical protein
MATILITIVIMLLVFGAMAFGVLMGRQPIKGSCGGMSAIAAGGTCEVCGGNPDRCPEERSGAEPGVGQYVPKSQQEHR